MIGWLRENKIMERIYGDNLHSEIIRRSGDIPKYLARRRNLTIEDLDLLWEASSGKHESVQHIMHTSLSELAECLSEEQIDYILQKIAAIPLAAFDATALKLLRSYALRCCYFKVWIKQNTPSFLPRSNTMFCCRCVSVLVTSVCLVRFSSHTKVRLVSISLGV
jgi:hypothetical protein